MPREALKAGMAFHSCLIDDGIFLFDHSCSLFSGEGLYRRFNRVGGFVEKDWYRFPDHSHLLTKAKEFDFVR
ncbi:hypothetical protein [Nitrospira sp. T9]|uniref:hypothetical protein n=1 Tax=unclassified Nitrospira TaxID=2652172 RepID=UPI003F9DD0D6